MIKLVIGGIAVVAGLGLMAYVAKKAKQENEKIERARKEGDAFYVSHVENNLDGWRKVSPAIGLVPVAIGAVIIATSCFYAQDVGEAVVLRNLGGSLAGHTVESGFHLKAPWQDALGWDIRNRQVNFYSDAEYRYDGGSYEGAQVTINDASGTKANIDLQVIYSIDADSVESLYEEYGTQEAFVVNYVSNDVRATAREQAGRYDTITLLTDRSKFTDAISQALAEQWEGRGVIVEQVQVQDIRYAKSITEAYADAQSAEVAKQKALNAQETAKVEAETKKIEAQGEADANRVLTESLTPEVLQQQYNDALKTAAKNGGLIVVPEGSQPIVGTGKE